jgi:lysophospholipase L1-like esterase
MGGMMKVFRRAFLITLLICSALAAQAPYVKDGQRILFLGDSITQDGRYVEDIEAFLIVDYPKLHVDIIKLGLSSETTQGLTEPDHPSPRPNIHDRLDSALEKAKPDIVVACYGMNDGIYHPFSEERFQAYQDGVRKLIARVRAAGATVVLVTPPPFDAVSARAKVVSAGAPQFGYNTPYDKYDSEVLERYGEWLLTLRGEDLMVIDVHRPMVEEVKTQREKKPDFTLAEDGVHPDAEGHWIMARTVLQAWGVPDPQAPRPDVLEIIHQKWQVLGPAWLARVGHKGNPKPVDFEAASAAAAELESKARALVQ